MGGVRWWVDWWRRRFSSDSADSTVDGRGQRSNPSHSDWPSGPQGGDRCGHHPRGPMANEGPLTLHYAVVLMKDWVIF